MNNRMKALTALVFACVTVVASPAHAASETMTEPVGDRFVIGNGSFYVIPVAASNNVTVVFECTAVAGPDASQTRVLPPSQDGCVLTKGGVVVGKAPGASFSGPAAVTYGSASVSLDQPGEFGVCWRVAATFLTDGGSELSSSGCAV